MTKERCACDRQEQGSRHLQKTKYKNRECLRICMQKKRLADDFDATILTQLKHRHVVKVYDTAVEGDAVILWEEYIKGDTLTDWIKKQEAKNRTQTGGQIHRLRRMKSILMQLCHAVQYLHEMKPKQIIHGDIKPDNIMVRRCGQIRLIDFSASRMIAEPGRTNQNGVQSVKRYGTAYFTAPEVYKGALADERQDIYGIGVTLLYMLCGEAAMQAADKEKAILCDETDAVLPLLHIAYHCIREEPELRYQTVGDLLADIKRKRTSTFSRQVLGVTRHRSIKRCLSGAKRNGI